VGRVQVATCGVLDLENNPCLAVGDSTQKQAQKMKEVKSIVAMYLRAQSGCTAARETSTGNTCYAMRPKASSRDV